MEGGCTGQGTSCGATVSGFSTLGLLPATFLIPALLPAAFRLWSQTYVPWTAWAWQKPSSEAQ